MRWLCPKCRTTSEGEDSRCPKDGTELIHNLGGNVLAGRWGIEGLLSIGGGGSTVWSAFGVLTRNPVAIKITRSSHLAEVARFERGSRISGMLDHPNIARIIEHGHDEELILLVMELLEGETLKSLLARQGRLSPAAAAHIAGQVLDALGYAHGLGIVHRDIKLSNVFIAPTRVDPLHVKILDWGIARFIDHEPGLPSGASSDEVAVTQAQQILGTPEYMAPEQIVGGPPDPRSDIYAVGIMLYKLLAGRHPFEARTRSEMYQAHLTQEPPPLPAAYGAGLDALIKRALAKSPADRWGSAMTMQRALGAVIRSLGAAAAEPVADVPRDPTPVRLTAYETHPKGLTALRATSTSAAAPVGVEKRRRGLWLGAMAAAGVLAAAAAAFVAFGGGGPDRAAPAQARVELERPVPPEAPIASAASSAAASEAPVRGERNAETSSVGDAKAPPAAVVPEPEPKSAEVADEIPEAPAAEERAAATPTPPPASPVGVGAATSPKRTDAPRREHQPTRINRPVKTAEPSEPTPAPPPEAAPAAPVVAAVEPATAPEIDPLDSLADLAEPEPPAASERAPVVAKRELAAPEPEAVAPAPSEVATPRVRDNRPIPFGAGMSRPVRVAGVQPSYTRQALMMKVEGTMIVRCVIELDGSLSGCRILKSVPHMEAAVREALATWRYRPVIVDGQPRRVSYTFNFNFVMPD